MPTAGELRLEQAHQRDLATISAGVLSGVANIALGADPAAISTWFFTALDAITARVQVGYAQARRSGTGYMQSRATMAGADVDVRAGSLNLAQARTSLEVTGPVAFKRAIAAGADDEEALLSMATQMSGSAQRLAIAGDRDVLEQTLERGKGLVGYRRVLGGPGCGFCAMLASRGAVYLSRESASMTRSGLRFHDHCRCSVSPLFDHEPDPLDVRRLQRQWQRITAGETGKAKATAWRNYWENDLVDRSKLRLAAAKAGPPSPVPRAPTPAPGVAVRSGLDAKKTLTGLQEAWSAEAKRITGRILDVDIPAGTSLQTAKEYAEGVLRGLERFPDAALERIRFGQMARDQYAEAGMGEMTFNARWANMANRPALVSGMQNDIAGWSQGRNGWSTRGDGTPMALSLHEFAHIIDIDNLGEAIHSRALSLATRRAALEGIPVDDLIARDISVYATSSEHELIAEAFADVMLRGQAASPLSKEIFDLLEAEYFKAGGRITPAFGTFPAKAAPNLARMTVPQLRALAAERGVTLPAKALKADIVRALEEAGPPVPRIPAVPIATGREALRTAEIDLSGKRPAGVTVAEVKAVDLYANDAQRINALIREGRTASDTIRNLDRLIGRSTLTSDTELWRGLRSDSLFGDAARRDLTGFEWTDQAYLSTSANREWAARFAGSFDDPKPVILRVVAPQGTHGITVSDWGSFPLGPGGQAEVLLARGQRLRVVRDRGLITEPGISVPVRSLDVEVVSAEPGAARWLGNVDLPPAEAERIGQLVQAKSRRDILDEIVQLRADGASNRALANRIRGRAALPNTYDVAPQVDDAFRDELLAAVDNGTIDDVVRRHLAALDVAPVVEKPLAKRTVAELRALAKERQITLPPKATKAQIVEALQAPPLSAAEKAAAEKKALREAARERNRQIEQATGTARLLAEVDELLAKKATAVTIRQRLDPALIRAEQVFANADPAVREALAAALASGDMAKVRAAITRLTTKAKLKVVGGKAGAKVKFDPDTMESLGAEIADGAPVTVVTRGASVTLPDGAVVQVRKAQVTAVAKPPDQWSPAAYEARRREVDDIINAGGILHERPLGGGAQAETKLLTDPTDGRQVVRKDYGRGPGGVVFPRSGDAPLLASGEELASRVFDAIGVRVPSISRIDRDSIAIEYIDGTLGDDIVPYGHSVSQAILDTDDARLIGLADYLTYGADRNTGNWIRLSDGRIAAIDFGGNFGDFRDPYFDPKVPYGLWGDFSGYLRGVDDAAGNPVLAAAVDLSPADLRVVRARLMKLRPEFAARGRLDWYTAMVRQLRELGKRATGTRNMLAP